LVILKHYLDVIFERILVHSTGDKKNIFGIHGGFYQK